MMFQCRGLRDFVPEVLNVAVPEVSDQGLLRGAGFAGDETQTFDFIENPFVLVACQLWRRSGTKFVSARQGKRSYLGPLREVCRCEIGRRKLVFSRLVYRNIGGASDIRTVGAAERQNLGGHGLSDGEAVRLVLPTRDL